MLFLWFVAVWVAFFLGVIVGSAWKPRWATLGQDGKLNFSSPIKGFGGNPSYGTCAMEDDGVEKEQASSVPVPKDTNCR